MIWHDLTSLSDAIWLSCDLDQSFDHAGGRLHIINLTRRAVVDKQTKESR